MTEHSLHDFLRHLTSDPGVYRMIDAHGTVLYVGKAKNLKKRVSSYFKRTSESPKHLALVRQIASIDVSVTRSETEALLLESTWIKTLRPKYNVVMRDDKTYPYLQISGHPDYPRLGVIRSKQKPRHGEYFGPYPSRLAVRETLHMIQKIFKLRPCSDTYFQARSRPCLQYQIKRCSAPCMKYISPQAYQASLNGARLFLQGKNQDLLIVLGDQMQQAIERLAFEEAAVLRDQMQKLRLVQEAQAMVTHDGEADILAVEARPGFACVQRVRVRHGQIVSDDHFFPSVPANALVLDENALWQEVFTAYMAYAYFDDPSTIPALIITNRVVDDHKIMQTLLSEQAGRRCRINSNPRGMAAKWLDFAQNNLQRVIHEAQVCVDHREQRYQALAELLNCGAPIKRMECFDISHTQGNNTKASCVVFDASGPCKRAYRTFNIQGITPGDDFAAMEQALLRRFSRLSRGQAILTDVLVIDGGVGQVAVAHRVLATLNITSILVVGVAKGPARKAGQERLLLAHLDQELTLPEHSPALHLLQHIRDEAHRFAITAHRRARHKNSLASTLETIEGVGKKRHQALLHRFGGLRALSTASVEEIKKVPGIGPDLAVRIYEHFR